MIEYLDTVLIPYVVETRQELELADDHPALALFDVFAAHRSNEVLSKLRANNIHVHQIFVPASCKGELQPLDVGINGDFKQLMKDSFSRWYSDDVRAAMDEGQSVSDIKVDLRASVIKPLHANWVISAITTLSDKQATLKKPFDTIGISEFFDN